MLITQHLAPAGAVMSRTKRRATMLMTGLLILTAVLATAGPATADAPATAVMTAHSPTEFTSSTVDAASDPIPSRRAEIARLAISQIGAREHGGEDHYPKRYQNIDKKNISRPAEWCGVFTYWAWAKAGVTKLPPMNIAANGTAQGHWATYWKKRGADHNRWKPISARNPKIGDAIVYGDYNDVGHVGVVVGVKHNRNGKATHVRTVEGNVADKVTDLGWRKITELTGGGRQATGFVSPI